MYAALTPTAGGVIFTGHLEGKFLALDARNGKPCTASIPAARSPAAW